VRTSLEKATQEHRQITLRLESLDRAPEERVPTVEEILTLVLDVEARVADDPVGARELLRELLLDGKIAMHPQEDGTYKGSSVVFPMHLRWKTRKPPSASAARAFDVVEDAGCAGANRTASTSGDEPPIPLVILVPPALDRRKHPSTWKRRVA
jgi:hypothetical protein